MLGDAGELTADGVQAIGRWFKANYVHDENKFANLWVDALRHAFEKSVDGFAVKTREPDADFRAALLAGGAVALGDAFIKGRAVDELGVEYGPGDSEIPTLEYLVDEILPARSVGMFVAAPYELKTWAALSLAVAISQGLPWLGKYRTTRGRVIFFDYEMGGSEVRRRLTILNDDGSIGVASFPPFDLSDDRFWEQLENHNPDCVVVDSLSRAHPGVDEKDARYAEPLARAARFAAERGTSFIFIHHSPKAGGKGLSDLIRGTSALAAALDVAFHFEQIDGGDDPREKRAIVTCLKQRRGGQEPSPFKMKLTDAGVELYVPPTAKESADEPAEPLTLDEQIAAAVDRLAAEQPGDAVSYERIAKAIQKRTQDATTECKRLLGVGVLVNQGSDRRPDIRRSSLPSQ
jgi:hypothetical protein